MPRRFNGCGLATVQRGNTWSPGQAPNDRRQSRHPMKLSALHALIATGESLALELKKSTAEKDRACRSLCALANGQGEKAVFGVTPGGKVVGQKVSERTLEELAQKFQGFEPPLFPQLQRIPVSGGDEVELEALLVQVERATHGHRHARESAGGRPLHRRAGAQAGPEDCLPRRDCLAQRLHHVRAAPKAGPAVGQEWLCVTSRTSTRGLVWFGLVW